MKDKNQENKSIADVISETTSTNYVNIPSMGGAYNMYDWNTININTTPVPIHQIGQCVYHITPESSKGYVIDIRYNYKDNYHEYLVTWGPTVSDWYLDAELTLEVQF